VRARSCCSCALANWTHPRRIAARSYVLTMRSVVLHCSLLAVASAANISPFGGRAGPTFQLTSYGAVGDNATLNTKAFEAGVAAVAKAGGGTLVVPKGAFRTGPFNLTSHMTLFLDAGGAITGPTPAQLGQGPAFAMWKTVRVRAGSCCCWWRW